MIDGKPCSLRWITQPANVPVMSLSESGDSMFLVCLLGVVTYSRSKDTEDLAHHLEQLAAMVRKHG